MHAQANVIGYNRTAAGYTDSWPPSIPKLVGFWKGVTPWSEMSANHAEDFLIDALTEEFSSFMYLACNAPHDPRQSRSE